MSEHVCPCLPKPPSVHWTRFSSLVLHVRAVSYLFSKVLKKYPRLWCMTKPPSRRPKLYIVNLQVTWVLRVGFFDLGLTSEEPEGHPTSIPREV